MDTVIPRNKHFLTVDKLKSLGLSHYKINKLVENGTLIKVSRIMYENTAFSGDESDFSIVSAFAPKGVICMMNAARFYGLTTFLPDSVDVAIERSMKISALPDWLSVNIWYFPQIRYSSGIVVSSDNCCEFKIYDIEKTVVDILYYRNKIGIENAKEILNNYLARDDRDLIRLHRYADILGCGKILGTYLEVLV